jgi:protease-4
VKSGRPQLRQANAADGLWDARHQRDLATGEIFTAVQARQYGLIDEIGFIEDAIARAVELAELDPRHVRVVQYQRPLSLGNLVGMAEASPGDFPLEALWELSAPRAYYLATTWPPLVTSRRD